MHRFAAPLMLICACTSGPSAPEDTAPPEDTACPDLEPSLELGTGADGFEPLADGAPLAMIRGPQGGYHVYGSFRAEGFAEGVASNPFDLANPRVSFALAVDGEVVAALREQPRHLPADPATGEQQLVGEVVVVAIGEPLTLDGADATFSIEVTDACGRAAADERAVVVRYTPG